MNDFTNVQNQLHVNSISGGKSANNRHNSWFETMAEAWGQALDNQADRIVARADDFNNGLESPAQVTMLTAESLRMQFLSNASHTSLTSMGSALETMARKQ